ncbi:MAG: sulfate adenylyltransferase, partial [Woeseia sp.]|nr:sulfate adenylyltransferase [Woeseia sp.]
MRNPHGSEVLMPLSVTDPVAHKALSKEAASLPSLTLNSAAAANAVMLGGGYFTPLTGYMNLTDTLAVAERMQTADGLFWPVPIVNLTDDISAIENAARIALRDPNVADNPVIAVMDVENIEQISDEQLNTIIRNTFGTLDETHPGAIDFRGLGNYCVSGPVQVLNLSYFETEFSDTFRTAVQIREEIA